MIFDTKERHCTKKKRWPKELHELWNNLDSWQEESRPHCSAQMIQSSDKRTLLWGAIFINDTANPVHKTIHRGERQEGHDNCFINHKKTDLN